MFILPASVTNLAMFFDKLPDTTSSEYSFTLCAGWSVFTIAVLFSGQLVDRQVHTSRQRRIVIALAMATGFAISLVFSSITTFPVVAVAWIVLQISCAFALSIAQSATIEHTPLGDIKSPSGFIGGAPLVSVLLGSVALAVVGDHPYDFAINTALGCALLTPLLMNKSEISLANIEKSHAHVESSASWKRFLVASFLLAIATASTNSYIVVYCEDLLHQSATESLSLVTLTVFSATLLSIIAGILTSRMVRKSAQAFSSYRTGAVLTGLSIATLITFPSATTLFIGALFFGIGFGISNGQELHITKVLHHHKVRNAHSLGQLAAVTSMPYIIVPFFGTALFHTGLDHPVQSIWKFGAAAAIAAGIVIRKPAQVDA